MKWELMVTQLPARGYTGIPTPPLAAVRPYGKTAAPSLGIVTSLCRTAVVG